MFNPIQFHLMVVHVPVLGSTFATLLYALGRYQSKTEWMRIAQMLFLISAFAAIAAYLSGGASEDHVKNLFGVKPSNIEEHEEMATVGLILILLNGVLSTILLVIESGLSSRLKKTMGRLVLALGLAASVVFFITAHRGGLIRHPELTGDTSSLFAPQN